METAPPELPEGISNIGRSGHPGEHATAVQAEAQGLIHGFEFTHELAWNVLKDHLEEQGFVGIIGSKHASREAFKNGLIDDGQVWVDMIKAQNLTSHTYNTEVAERIVQDILARFYPAFNSMASHFKALATTLPDVTS